MMAAGTEHTDGLFDFQVNGFAGVDFQSDDLTEAQLVHAVEALERDGVSSIFFTLITDYERALAQRFLRVEAFRKANPRIARMIAGYHLEGPWLRAEPGYCGAHNMDAMCAPSLASFTHLQLAAGGNIRLVTLAPELPGSAEFIRALVDQGVHVALGHTNASNDDIDAAIAAGAKFCTHLGNGAPLQLHRHDNIIQRLLARDELVACFVPDGIHVPDFALKNFYRAKPTDKVLFTTDCMAAAGAPRNADYTIGRVRVYVGDDGIVRDKGPSKGFAGSALTPGQAIQLTSALLRIPEHMSRDFWSKKARLCLLPKSC